MSLVSFSVRDQQPSFISSVGSALSAIGSTIENALLDLIKLIGAVIIAPFRLLYNCFNSDSTQERSIVPQVETSIQQDNRILQLQRDGAPLQRELRAFLRALENNKSPASKALSTFHDKCRHGITPLSKDEIDALKKEGIALPPYSEPDEIRELQVKANKLEDIRNGMRQINSDHEIVQEYTVTINQFDEATTLN